METADEFLIAEPSYSGDESKLSVGLANIRAEVPDVGANQDAYMKQPVAEEHGDWIESELYVIGDHREAIVLNDLTAAKEKDRFLNQLPAGVSVRCRLRFSVLSRAVSSP